MGIQPVEIAIQPKVEAGPLIRDQVGTSSSVTEFSLRLSFL